jgi:phosphatidylserine/phosphatidylglycerophosphate/cardiolipin synthase-like enzyme
MLDLVGSPWVDQFDQLIDNCQSSLVLCSPFVSRGPCDRIIGRLQARRAVIAIQLLTDLSTDNLLSGATDAAALLAVAEQLPTAEIHYLPRLHAKVYVCDCTSAVVTSDNMTEGGLRRNHEYGVRVSDPPTVSRIRADVLRLAGLGARMPISELKLLVEAATDLRARRKTAESSIRSDARKAFEQRLVEVNDELLRVRASGRSVDAVFSDTILFVLRNGPLATQDIHREVQRIHPDLCDDSIDRVINGRHFGKKWKHAVRSAQSNLKQRGQIVLRDGRWESVG